MSNKEITFKYIFSHDYNPKYVNGAYGGITAKGEITVNFFLERQGLPITQTYEVSDEGKLVNEIKTNPDDLMGSMVRFVDTGIILNLNSAKTIVNWLTEKIDLLERLEKDEKLNKENKILS